MGDNRFKMMFEDEEFKRDPRLEAQKSYAGGDEKDDDSDDSDIE